MRSKEKARQNSFHLKKWKSYISSDEKSGTVLLAPIQGVEQLYLFQSEGWNSSIYSSRNGGTVISVPINFE